MFAVRPALTCAPHALRLVATAPTRHFNSLWRTLTGTAGSIRVTFITPSGEERVTAAALGDTMLEVAQKNKIDIEGACGGECACSTCHVILDKASFDKLPPPQEEEMDMLDLATGLTKTSRLGCQIVATKELDGMILQLPAEVNSMLDK